MGRIFLCVLFYSPAKSTDGQYLEESIKRETFGKAIHIDNINQPTVTTTAHIAISKDHSSKPKQNYKLHGCINIR